MGTPHLVLTRTISSSAAVWKGAAGCLHPSSPEASTPSIGMGDMSCSPQQREGTALTFQALHQASPLEARQLRLLHHGWKTAFLCKNRAPHVPVTPRKGKGGIPRDQTDRQTRVFHRLTQPKSAPRSLPCLKLRYLAAAPVFWGCTGLCLLPPSPPWPAATMEEGGEEGGGKMAARRHGNGAMALGAR